MTRPGNHPPAAPLRFAASGPLPSPGIRRTRYLTFLVALLVGVLVAGIAGTWFLYGSVRDEMDRQLGQRLLSIATTAARSIGSERVREVLQLGPDSPEYERLRAEFEGTARANDLDNIVLIDRDRGTVLDLRATAPALAPDPLLDIHPELRATLLSGEPRVTRLVEIAGLPGEFLKTGFAAVEDSAGEILGAIAVEGGSEFFAVLPGMRSRLRWAAGGGLVAVLVLGLLVVRVLRSLIRYEDSLRRAAALAAIGQISAVVAHEIRNPLAIIRSRSERVRAKILAGRDPKEVLEWFEAIPAEVDRLDRILTEYLSLARPDQEAGGSCRPAVIAEETANLLAPELHRHGVRLETEFEGVENLTVSMAARSLRQVLLNLMLNAVQAMDPGGGVLRVRIRSAGRQVAIDVEDTGPGMTDEVRARALEPFFTTRPTGSGLGLTLVQSLIQARGGVLEIRSAAGQGTRVTVALPSAREHRTSTASEGEAPPGRKSTEDELHRRPT